MFNLLNRLFFHNPKSRFCRLDGGGNGGGVGGDMTGYSFNPETGEFEGAYNVNTGKSMPGEMITITYDANGNPISFEGVPNSQVNGKGSEGFTGAGIAGTVENPKPGEPGGKKTEPIKEKPVVSKTPAQEKKRTRIRRPKTLLGMDQGWLGNSPFFVGGPRKLLGE